MLETDSADVLGEHHQKVLSFPTRRSSDLLSAPSARRKNVSPPRVRPSTSAQISGWRPRDRKSTRLNSSHQISSYAVFCLKKKRAEEGANEIIQLAPIPSNLAKLGVHIQPQ